MAMEFEAIGVVGGGQMGSGIAQLGIVRGLRVYLFDSDLEALTRASKSISASIQRLVSKNNVSEVEGKAALQRLDEMKACDLIIEAIVESEEVKRKLFIELDRIAKASAILASNTSSISITRLASITKRPAQVQEDGYMLSRLLRVHCEPHSDANDKRSILCPLHWGRNKDIDTGMKLGTNHPMGPLELADFIGLDVCLSIM